jgi:hypothetical protein
MEIWKSWKKGSVVTEMPQMPVVLWALTKFGRVSPHSHSLGMTK